MTEQLIVTILSTVVLTNIALALVIFSRGVKRLADILFSLISLSSGLWGLAIIGFHTKPEFLSDINWAVFTHLFAACISLFFFFFSFTFPRSIKGRLMAFVPASILFVVLSYALIFTDLIIGETTGKMYAINSGYFAYGLLVFLFFFGGYFFLYEQYRLARTKDEKRQVLLILAGAIAASLPATVPDLILPYYNNFSYTWLGPIFTLILVGSIFYAIVRYALFNIKLILAESTISIIIVFLIGDIIFAQDSAELILKAVTILFVVFLSHLLIKSVYNEIEQRKRIEGLAEELSQANEKLRELDKHKTEFVSFASHQLRSPLTAIKGYASMILEGDYGKLTVGMAEAVNKIYESSKTLASVVDDYLNISRIELGTMKYNFVPLDLREMTESVIGELKPNFERAKTTISLESDKRKSYKIHADPDKLKQVIANIVDNSVKYSPRGKVIVSLTRDEEKKIVRFVISDNGIGMSKETLAKLFNKFTRANNANSTNIRGTGLGLYVARDIIGAHKGKIWAESDGEGKGSRFIFELAAL